MGIIQNQIFELKVLEVRKKSDRVMHTFLSWDKR